MTHKTPPLKTFSPLSEHLPSAAVWEPFGDTMGERDPPNRRPRIAPQAATTVLRTPHLDATIYQLRGVARIGLTTPDGIAMKVR